MANTYTLIEAKTLGSAVASVTFSSIPQTYTDLKLVISPRSNRIVADDMKLQFNSNTTGYTAKRLYGNGAGTGSDSALHLNINGADSTSNTFSNVEYYIPNYTSSNYKSWSGDAVSENNGTEAYAEFGAYLWSNTAAITSISVITVNGDLISGSTFYLYGIKNS